MERLTKCDRSIFTVLKNAINQNTEFDGNIVEKQLNRLYDYEDLNATPEQCKAALKYKQPTCKSCKYFYCLSAVDRLFNCQHHYGLKHINVVENSTYCSYYETAEKAKERDGE